MDGRWACGAAPAGRPGSTADSNSRPRLRPAGATTLPQAGRRDRPGRLHGRHAGRKAARCDDAGPATSASLSCHCDRDVARRRWERQRALMTAAGRAWRAAHTLRRQAGAARPEKGRACEPSRAWSHCHATGTFPCLSQRLLVPKTVSHHATWEYSWISPPRRSRRITRVGHVESIAGGRSARPSGGV